MAAQGYRAPRPIEPPTATSGPSPSAPGEREVFLDAIRAIAILRVVAWHAFGVAAITYFVAAMPAMFFVTGSLLAKSMGRRAPRTVLADRFRRLLVPLWTFGAVAWLAMAVAARRMGTGLPLRRAVVWILPLADPHGTTWEGGWLSSHLWYVRTLVWLLLASPLLLRAVRRAGAGAVLVPLAAVFALDLASRRGGVIAANHGLVWGLGDLALYSVFLMVGFLHRQGTLRTVSRRGWVVAAVLFAGAASAWRLTQPVPLGVVNNSHPMHFFVGAGWLALALAGRDLLTRFGSTRVAGGAIRAIGRRSLTIYLWHTAAIIVAVNALDAASVDGPVAHALGLIALTALGTLVAVHLFGWVEDVAARRPPAPRRARSLQHLSRPAVALATLVAVAGVVLATPAHPGAGVSEAATPAAGAATASARRPPVPSQPPPAPVFHAGASAPAAAPAEAPAAAGPETSVPLVDIALDAMLAEWADDTGVQGAVVGIDRAGARWRGAVGERPDTGQAVAVTDRIALASLTKLFTASLVQRYAQAGLIDLDAPLPFIRSLPDFPYDLGITPGELLEHTSGLINYLDTTRYNNDPDSVDGPVAAVMASATDPQAFSPGASYMYSSTNFLVLGLLLEDVTGRSYDDLLRSELLDPLTLHDTVHLPPAPGWPRGATSGIETSLDDLLTAGNGILRDHIGLSDDTYAAMMDVDPSSGFGPGTFGFCPCRLDARGDPTFYGIGYYGATTLLVYVPTRDMTVAVDLVDSLGENGGYAAVETLFERLDALLG